MLIAMAEGGRRPSPFAAGLATIVAGGLLLRAWDLGANLPHVAGADEPPMLALAEDVLHGHLHASDIGWEPAPINLLGIVLRLATWLHLPVSTSAERLLIGRWLFVLVTMAAVVLAGVLGRHLADGRRTALVVGLGAAGALAFSYTSVRTGRQVNPDHLQLAFILGSVLATLAYDRTRSWRWLLTAGGLAGLAGASKYLGILAALPLGAALLLPPAGNGRSWRHVGLAVAAVPVGFLVGSPAALIDPHTFWEGIHFQLLRQDTGHLGYEPEGRALWFHLSQSLPGSWGWVMTVAAAVGLVLVARSGTRAQRLSLAYAGPVLLALAVFKTRLPYYVLTLLPFLGAYAFVLASRLGTALGRWAWLVPAALALTLVPTLGNDVRLVRAVTAEDTRVVADPIVAALPGRVIGEAYTPTWRADETTRSVADVPDAEHCNCYLVLSSYMEQRFRRRPDLYRHEVDAYDRIRRAGRVVRVIRPRWTDSYKWDLLPQFGLDQVPLRGPAGPAGPIVTVLDLRSGAGAPRPQPPPSEGRRP
jgi:hypothetical protein